MSDNIMYKIRRLQQLEDAKIRESSINIQMQMAWGFVLFMIAGVLINLFLI